MSVPPPPFGSDLPTPTPQPGIPGAPGTPGLPPQIPGYGFGPAPKRNGMSIAALVLGISSIATCVTIILGIPLGIVAVILGILGVRNANKGISDKKGLAIAGIVTGAVGLILGVVMTWFFFGGPMEQYCRDNPDIEGCSDLLEFYDS